MTRRRVLYVLLVLTFTIGTLGLMGLALAPSGLGLLDWSIMAVFAVVAPWLSIGFCNALVGVWLTLFSKAPWQPLPANVQAEPLLLADETEPPSKKPPCCCVFVTKRQLDWCAI